MMPHRLRIILMVLAIFAPFTAVADGRWVELVNALRREGIETTDIDWISVNNLCSSLAADPVAYYDCRYPLAKNYVRHKNDATVCRRMERQNRRAALMPIGRYPNKAPKFTSQAEEHEYYRQYHEALHYQQRVQPFTFDQCMADRGWVDGQNWRAGRLD